MDIFYNKMKEIRKDADKSQREIAEILKITQQQYQLYESGKRYIPVDLLKSFCEYFKVSADYILGLDPDLTWPREERRKRRYTGDCTKYIFLHVNFELKGKTSKLLSYKNQESAGGLKYDQCAHWLHPSSPHAFFSHSWVPIFFFFFATGGTKVDDAAAGHT